MNKERDKVFSEMGSKYGIDMKGKTPIGDLPNIMSKADWLLVSCFLKYPNGVPKDKSMSEVDVLSLILNAIYFARNESDLFLDSFAMRESLYTNLDVINLCKDIQDKKYLITLTVNHEVQS
mgnify:FL=1